ncbi:MAG: class I SAM-dependent methyltransferase [Gemmatimonadota bacterium]|nr:MAG: class I SAM-dependent methyltransferase [Gemmatimonadota bacterium]
MSYAWRTFRVVPALCLGFSFSAAIAQEVVRQQDIDVRVRQFLDAHRYEWRAANISATDGRVLYDLVLDNGYTKALEIGTSTGHSAIWIAWALSKTGGKLITIEIDERRHRQAVANFQEAGLSEFIDARLADAHELVPQLAGPFDFVFLDADKEWYTRYFRAVHPKLEVGGCFTAHNVSGRRMRGIGEFLDELEGTPGLETEIVGASRSGLSVSYKRSAQRGSHE